MVDFIVNYSTIAKVMWALITLAVGWYITLKLKASRGRQNMIYVYLNYRHFGKEDKPQDLKVVKNMFKFSDEDSLFNFIQKESENCRFELENIVQIKM